MEDTHQFYAFQADAHFSKMIRKSNSGASHAHSVVKVKVVRNSKLEEAFEKKKKEYIKKKIPSDPIFAYHGTNNDQTVIDNILKNNFDMKFARRQVHGPGHYSRNTPIPVSDMDKA